jgi:signal transduction histidine kinase
MGDTGTAEERQENWSGKLRRDIERLRESYRESLRRVRDTCGRLRSVNIMENPRKV